MAHKSTKTIWYKRATIGTEVDNLQDLLERALAARASASDRIFQPSDEAEHHAINAHTKSGNMLVGQFLAFEEGRRQPLITLGGGQVVFELGTIGPGGDEAEHREFLESIAYFGVLQNHVLLVQTKVLGSKQFERYLQWLLQEETQVLEEATVFALADQVPNATRRRAAGRRVRGVTIGSPVRTVAERKGRDAATTFVLNDESAATFAGLFGQDWLDRLNLRDALEPDSIEVRVTIRVKGKQRISAAGSDFLEQISRAARHLAPDDYSLEVQGIGKLKGEDLKLFKSVTVELTEKGGLTNETSLWFQMTEYLTTLLQSQMIET